MCYEYSVKWLRTPTKCPRNIPQQRNAHTAILGKYKKGTP